MTENTVLGMLVLVIPFSIGVGLVKKSLGWFFITFPVSLLVLAVLCSTHITVGSAK